MADGGDGSSENRVLLVEGWDDMHVVCHLCEPNPITPTFTVSPKGGIDPLLKGIRSEISVEGRTVVGILVDANDDLQSRWDAVAGRLREANIEPPSGPASNGTIIESRPHEGKPRVGVWLMPDNQSPGELEDFIEGMIPPHDRVWPMSEDYIDGIPVKHRKFKAGKILRAKVHAWLATRRRPRQMATAIEAGDLNTDTETCQRFLGWLRQLFEDEQ